VTAGCVGAGRVSDLINESELDTMTACVFGDITFDRARRRVHRGETSIRLGKLTYELLLLLISAAPRVVTHEEIAEHLWRGRRVTAETVRQRIKLLRKALADNPAHPRYIRVVRGHGYQLIPDVLEIEASRPPRLARVSRATAGGLLGAVAALAIAVAIIVIRPPANDGLGPTYGSMAVTDVARTRNSVAVLPFENLSRTPDDAYLVDGIHGDVITQLAKVASLRVISRASVTEYRGNSKNATQIGRELDVATILEGSVQRAANDVRINVQLTDTTTGAAIWAELYDRELTPENVFSIQNEMAASIASALRATLTPDDLARLGHVPTQNAKAYSHYLVGINQLRQADNMTDHTKAAEAFEAAVGEDPEFALAWAALAHAYSAMYFFVDHTDARRDMARMAVDRASAIDADLPETHLARGYYYYQCAGEFARALEEWEIAERDIPGDSRIHMARAYLYRHIGNYTEAAKNLELATALDPRNVENLAVQFETLGYLHEYDEALRYADRVIAIGPDRPQGYVQKYVVSLWRSGDGAAALEALDSGPREFAVPHLRWAAYLYERDYEAALHVLTKYDLKTLDQRALYRPKDWYFGVTHELLGNADLAASHYRAAREEAERMLARRPQDARVMVALADILARQGAHGDAADLAARALDAIPESVPMPQRYSVHLNAIRALAAAEDYDTSFVELEKFLAKSNPWSLAGLLRDPRLGTLASDPRVLALADTNP